MYRIGIRSKAKREVADEMTPGQLRAERERLARKARESASQDDSKR